MVAGAGVEPNTSLAYETRWSPRLPAVALLAGFEPADIDFGGRAVAIDSRAWFRGEDSNPRFSLQRTVVYR